MVTDATVKKLPGPKTRLGKKCHQWTPEEDNFVLARYHGTRESAKAIADMLGVSPIAVKQRIPVLGIALHRGKPWTPQEIKRLQELAPHYSTPVIARKLQRGVNSVAVKIKRLHISRRVRDGWFTKREVADICGVDHKMVQQWMDKGLLKVVPHSDVVPSNTGGSLWHVDIADLRKFIIKHSIELLGRNVDVFALVNILVPADEMPLFGNIDE